MEKYKIKKGSVMETLLIPLYGKMKAVELYPDLFKDKDCVELLKKIDYDFEEFGKIKMNIGAIMAGTRQYDLVNASKDYLKTHENAVVVNLGCGLDTIFSQISNGKAKAYNIDFPEVIELRNELLGNREFETNIISDITDKNWFDKIEFSKDEGAVFFASGVLYYIKKAEIKNLIINMAEAFPGGKVVFDATNSKGLKKMLKTWLKPTEMGEVDLYFSLEDEKEILKWSDKIDKVVKKGYMTGYRPLDKRFGFIANTLFKYGEKTNMTQIIEIYFKE